MFDLTPYLMGDPSAAFRRPPTEEEARRAMRDYAYEPPVRGRPTPLSAICAVVPIGGVLTASTEREAESYRQWFSYRDKFARIKKQTANLWTVTRVR